MIEEWRDVPDFPGYRVSNAGRVIGKRGHVLSPGVCSRGYTRVILMRDGKRLNRSVHRLVLTAFVGPAPSSAPNGAHLNGDPRDNRLLNLAWTDQAENLSHRKGHGTELLGERNGRALLTADDVRKIREGLAGGVTSAALAREYGVRPGTVSSIKGGKSWRHVA